MANTSKYYLDLDGLKALIAKIVASDKELEVKANDVYTVSKTSAGTTLTLTTGNGLEKNSSTLSAKAGNGITIDANGIAVNPKTNGGVTVDSSGVSIDTSNFKIVATTPGAGYAGSYELQLNGKKVGDTINIPEDQFLKDVSYVTTAPATPEGNSASVTFPALKFTWSLDRDAESAGDQVTTYVSVADLGAAAKTSIELTSGTTATSGTNYVNVALNNTGITDGHDNYVIKSTTALDNALAAGLTKVTGASGASAGSTNYVMVSEKTAANASTGANAEYEVKSTAALDTALANAKTVVAKGTNISVAATGNSGATPTTYTVSAVSGSMTHNTVASADDTLTANSGDSDKLATVGNVATQVSAFVNARLGEEIGALEGTDIAYSNTTSGLAATNVQSAIDELDRTIDGLGSTYKALQTAVTDSATSTAKVVTKVTQDEQGVITATKEDLSDVVLAGYANPYTTVAPQNTGIDATDTVEQGLGKVEYRLGQLETSTGAARNVVDNDVIAVDNNTANQQKLTVGVGDGLTKSSNKIVANLGTGLTFDSSKITIDTGANSGLTLKKLVSGDTDYNSDYASQYELRLGGTKIGDRIDLVKDQFLKSVTVATSAPQTAEGNSASITSWPALRFEWALDTDDQTAGAQTVTYISVSDFAATGVFGTVDSSTGAIGIPTSAGFATVGDVTSTVNSVRTSLNANQTSSNGNNVNVTVTETNGLISAVSVTDNTKVVVANDVYTVADGTTAGTQKLTISVDGTTITKANDALKANTGTLNYTAATSSADATLTATSGDTNKLATVGDVADKVEDFVNNRIADELRKLDLSKTYKTKQEEVTDGSTATAADNDLVVTAVTQNANGEITVVKNTAGAMLMTGYSKGSNSTDIATTDSIGAAFGKVENRLDGIEAVTGSIKSPSVAWVEDYFEATVAGTTPPSDSNADSYTHS